MEIIGAKSDPYIRLKLENQEYKTKTAKRTIAPKYDQDFEFFVTEKNSELELAVWHWDRFRKDEFMGRATLKIYTLKEGTAQLWLPLEKIKDSDKVSGDILVHYTFSLGG